MTAHDPKPLTVLVAEDEPAMLTLVARYMRRLGFDVIEASEGDTAWELAQEHTPDLVILDVMMPGMSGWEVCKRLKGQGPHGQFGDTGVIMLTGIGENLNEMTSSLFAADAWLNKPFQFPELDEKVRQTLARYEKTERMPDTEALNGESDNAQRERIFTLPDEDDDDLNEVLSPEAFAREEEEVSLDAQGRGGQGGGRPRAAAPKKKAAAKRAPAGKKAAAKGTVAKKPAAKKPAPAKSAKKPAAKKPAAKKPAAKKPAKSAKKPAAKKPAAKKPAAKKPAAKKPAAPKAKKAPPKKVGAKKKPGRSSKA